MAAAPVLLAAQLASAAWWPISAQRSGSANLEALGLDGYLLLRALGLQPLHPFPDQLALQSREVVDEHRPVQVIRLVLNGDRQQLFRHQGLGVSFGVKKLDGHLGGSLDLLRFARDREASFGVNHLALERDDLGVHHRHRLRIRLARRGIEDNHVLEHAYLRSSETNAVGGIHGLEHVVHQGADRIVDVGDRRGLLLQNRIRPNQNFTNHASSIIAQPSPGNGAVTTCAYGIWGLTPNPRDSWHRAALARHPGEPLPPRPAWNEPGVPSGAPWGPGGPRI